MNHSNIDRHTEAGLPSVIQRDHQAHDARDTDAALVTFSPTAVVTDDDATASGHAQIRHWLETAASEFTYRRTQLEVTSRGPDEWLILNRITGNFPGGSER